MMIYILDKKTGSTKGVAQATDYDLPLDTLMGSPGSIAAEGAAASPGDVAVVNREIYVVSEVEVGEVGTSRWTVQEGAALLSRSLFYNARRQGESVEGYLCRMVDAHYTQQADPPYRRPWISAQAGTHTMAHWQPCAEGEVWDIHSALYGLGRSHGIWAGVHMTAGGVGIRFYQKNPATHRIDLSLSRYGGSVLHQTGDGTARVSVRAQDSGRVLDYYLMADGQVHSQPKGNRAEGDWRRVVVPTEAEAEAAAQKILDENSHTHLAEFASADRLGYLDQLTLRTQEGKVLHSRVTDVRAVQGDERYHYKAGDLRVLVGEALNKERIQSDG